MKKKWLIFIAALLVFAQIPTQAQAEETEPYRNVLISIDHNKVVNGRTLVPIRAITEAIGAQVQWNQADNRIAITRDDTQIMLQTNSKQVQVNGQLQMLDAAAIVDKGTTFVPLRFVAETMGMEINVAPKARYIYVRDTRSKVEVIIEVKPPLSIEEAIKLLNHAELAHDLSAIKQKREYLRPYFTDEYINLIIRDGGLNQYKPGQSNRFKDPSFRSFKDAKYPNYTYVNDHTMLLSRSIPISNGPLGASGSLDEHGTLVQTANGWRIASIQWVFYEAY
ncbi:hypothetical protein FHS15_000605 [Paenibacillus castaneae]|uniref:copper amine oxidase N-terminal domain-containing protein n=1 Tax=Paenibacillus castaneae TaxID=474957 RepID=UPI000C9CE3EC|nr:copper amine oxidase N-terminal domain-containing protein [Paenibacillus castaneae]NIK75505.1 hypothetical protein [Paenibacillus castaneae]